MMSVLGTWSSRRASRDLLRAGWAEPVDVTWPAVSLAATILAFALLRVWTVWEQWPGFVKAYGTWRGLDMSTSSGWVLARLITPDLGGAALLDLALAVLLLVCAHLVGRRVQSARVVAVVVAGGTALDAFAAVAYPVPWWFLAASVGLALYCVILIGYLTRPTVSMHLRPEPAWVGRPPARPRHPSP